LTKCPNAPILIVVEIHGAIHVLIHGVISVPEVVPVHLDRRQELADRQDLVRVAQPALVMTNAVVILVVILVVAIVIVPHVVTMAIDPAAIVDRVASSVTVPVAIVIGLLVVTDLIHGAILVVAIVQPEIVGPVVIVVHGVNMATDRFVVMTVLILVVAIVIVRPAVILAIVTVHPAVILAIVIVPLVVISAIDRALTAVRVVNMAIGRVVIVVHGVNMAIDRYVVTTVLILAVAIVTVHPAVISVIVTVHPAVNSVIDRLVAMIQVLIHVAATEIVLLVAMALVLDVRQAHVVMTVGTVVAAVGRVAKTSLLVDLRTKPNVVVKPCAHEVAVRCVKTASKLRCHAKLRPGLTKAELKMKSAMPPKVQCAVRSHRDALCRRDQKMKMN
jgi:hypothetical protein